MNYGPTLTADQIGHIRDELERTLRKLERVRVPEARAREIDQSAVGRLSRIEALQNQGLTQNLQERERSKFEEVLQALGRLDNGTFGLCSGCHAQIAYERLLVFPETRTCSGCRAGH
jgi:DnaK suppressor protein